MKKTPACDPAPAPAPVRDRSQYVAGTVIVLCIVALTLGYIFTTADRAVPTSTAVTTAATPAQLETTTSSTTKAPDIPGRIVCFTEVEIEDTNGVTELCTDVVLLVTFDPTGHAQQDLTFLNKVKASVDNKLVIGMRIESHQELEIFDHVVKSKEWNLTTLHALTQVSLTNETALKLQVAATKLRKIEIIGLLTTSQVKATVDALPLIPGLEVVVVTPECEAYPWNRKEDLAYLNAVKRETTLNIAPSLTAAVWKTKNKNQRSADTCSAWEDFTDGMVACVENQPLEECRKTGAAFVDNETIAELVKYAKSKGMNVFAVFSVQQIANTAHLNRQFHLLRFSRPAVPAKNLLLPGIPLRQPGLDDSPSSGSGLREVTAASIPGSDTEPAGSGTSLEAAEQRVKSGVAKDSSLKSAKRMKKPKRGSVASSVPPIPTIRETKTRRAPDWAASTTSATPRSRASCQPAEGCTQT